MICRPFSALLLIFLASVPLVSQRSNACACVMTPTYHTPRHQLGVAYIFGPSGLPGDPPSTLFGCKERLHGSQNPASGLNLPLLHNKDCSAQEEVSGEGIDALILVRNQALLQEASSSSLGHVGLNLGVSDGNAGNLPQASQSSFGTNDLLLGDTYNVDLRNASVIFQLSGGRGENKIDRLQRGDDLLVHAEYRFSFVPLHLTSKLLAIKRLHKSSVRNSLSSDPHSNQFLVDSRQRAILFLSQDNALQLQASVPQRKRDVNVRWLEAQPPTVRRGYTQLLRQFSASENNLDSLREHDV